VDDDSLFRSLVALGTVLIKPSTHDAALAQAKASGLVDLLRQWADPSMPVSQRVKEALEDLHKCMS
jgi:hypothetical protein